MGNYDWIGPLVGGIAKGVNSIGSGNAANQQMNDAYALMLQNLKDRMGDYDKLGTAGYQPVAAQQLGPSALEGIQNDPEGRIAQQQAMASLGDLANRGGLNLADTAALNDIQGNLNRNNSARQQGLANQYAARGQLGSGAQLSMDLANNQNAAQNANQQGEATAGQAQARAMQAIMAKGQMGRTMSQDEYNKAKSAAEARDAIEARNAAARTHAGEYGNAVKGQAYEDALAQVRGKAGITNSINATTFGQGRGNAGNTLAQGGYRNDLIGQGMKAFGSSGGSGGSTSGDTPTPGNGDTQNFNSNLQPDASDSVPEEDQSSYY
jgi:hypothetical protein